MYWKSSCCEAGSPEQATEYRSLLSGACSGTPGVGPTVSWGSDGDRTSVGQYRLEAGLLEADRGSRLERAAPVDERVVLALVGIGQLGLDVRSQLGVK